MKKQISMKDIFKNTRYRGKHIILAAGKLYKNWKLLKANLTTLSS